MANEHDTPDEGGDWCPNGCQPFCGLGGCGMCGYEGDGVHQDETDFVIDACEETEAYTRQTPDGLCCGCGCGCGKQH